MQMLLRVLFHASIIFALTNTISIIAGTQDVPVLQQLLGWINHTAYLYFSLAVSITMNGMRLLFILYLATVCLCVAHWPMPLILPVLIAIAAGAATGILLRYVFVETQRDDPANPV